MNLNSIRAWFTKKPRPYAPEGEKTKEIGQILEGIKQESSKMSEKLKVVSQPDILRSLVISMNESRNNP